MTKHIKNENDCLEVNKSTHALRMAPCDSETAFQVRFEFNDHSFHLNYKKKNLITQIYQIFSFSKSLRS